MTVGEVIRALESRKRIIKLEAQKEAQNIYVLANLIGKSVSRIYSSNNRMPEINEIWPNLFNDDEIQDKRQEQKDKLSIARFKAFSDNFNARFKKEAEK